MNIFRKLRDSFIKYLKPDSLISDEGLEILNNPIKRAKLREWIDIYHKTGVWDYSFWEEGKSINDKMFYCQSKIEGDKKCISQCEHCEEYYKPLKFKTK